MIWTDPNKNSNASRNTPIELKHLIELKARKTTVWIPQNNPISIPQNMKRHLN